MAPLVRFALAALAFCALGARAADVDVESEDGEELDLDKLKLDLNRLNIKEDEHVSDLQIVEEIAGGDHVKKHPHLESHIIFSNTGNRTEFVAGEPVDLIVGLSNKGKAKPITMKGIFASVRYPEQWDFHMQNFTGQQLETVLEPGEEASVMYTFTPHESFDPRKYGLTVLVEYEIDKAVYRGDVFNSTFTIADSEDVMDVQTIFMLLVTLGCVAGVGVVAKNAMGTSGKKRTKAPAARVERGTVKQADASWLEGTSVAAGAKKTRK